MVVKSFDCCVHKHDGPSHKNCNCPNLSRTSPFSPVRLAFRIRTAAGSPIPLPPNSLAYFALGNCLNDSLWQHFCWPLNSWRLGTYACVLFPFLQEQDRPEAFVEDPATVRARQEAKFGRSQETSGKYDVKGRGRGAGQTDQVLRNRRWKESHKGSRANHNRRAMADKKMKKGMF